MKHDTCSGLDQADYFETTLDLFPATPSLVHENYGSSVSKSDLVGAYGGSSMAVAICASYQYLSEIRVCIGMASGGSPTRRIQCPSTVLSQNNC